MLPALNADPDVWHDRITGMSVNGVSRTFGYDDTHQLTSDNGTSLTYDANGNRTLSGYVTGDGNRMTSDGVWTYTHDLNGNVVGKSKTGESWTYEYDHRGQMIEASDGTVTVEYAYDAFGNRITRTEDDGTTATVEKYVVDGWDTSKPSPRGTENFDVVMDLDGSDDVTMRRLFGAGFDDLIGRQDDAGEVLWYGTDHLGSVRTIFDNSGDIESTVDYDAFGGFLGGVPVDRYAYTGREWDETLGLQYNRARMYDTANGRWMGEDPIGFAAGDPNLGRYVGNQPTGATDPSGMVPPGYTKTELEYFRDFAMQIFSQHALWSGLNIDLKALRKDPTYLNDEEYRRLVEEYSRHIAKIRIDPLPRNEFANFFPKSFKSIDTLERMAPNTLCKDRYDTWKRQADQLRTAIHRRKYEANTTRVYRFTTGFLVAGAKSAAGTVEVIADYEKVPGAVWNLATDRATQKLIADQIADKLSDDSADNYGELTFDVVTLVAGAPSAARGVAKVASTSVKLTVKISRETADALRKQKGNLSKLSLDACETTGRAAPGGLRQATYGTGANFPGTLNQPFTGSFADLTAEIQKVSPGFKGFVENATIPGGAPARFNPVTNQIEFGMGFNKTTKGLVAEEVRHGLDVAEGFNFHAVVAAFKTETGLEAVNNITKFQAWHHRRVYTRMLQDADRAHPIMGKIVGKGDVDSIYELYQLEGFGRSPKDWLLQQNFPNHYHAK